MRSLDGYLWCLRASQNAHIFVSLVLVIVLVKALTFLTATPFTNLSVNPSSTSPIYVRDPNLIITLCRTDSRLAPSRWETSLQSNAVPHRLGANLNQTWLCHQSSSVDENVRHVLLQCLWILWFLISLCSPDGVFIDGQRYLKKYCGT